MNPYDHAHALAKAIRESDGFRAMKMAKQKIDPDDQAKKMLLDFHMKQFEYERKRLMNEEPSQEDQEDLQKLYEILQLHTAVRDYLQAEYQLGTLMQDVQKILTDALEEVSIS